MFTIQNLISFLIRDCGSFVLLKQNKQRKGRMTQWLSTSSVKCECASLRSMAPTAHSLSPPTTASSASSAPDSQEVWQDETRRFGLHAVDPEVGTAGVILVAPVQQLEVVRLRVERLAEKNQTKRKRWGSNWMHTLHVHAPQSVKGRGNKQTKTFYWTTVTCLFKGEAVGLLFRNLQSKNKGDVLKHCSSFNIIFEID